MELTSRKPVRRKKKKRQHHGGTSPCAGCTTHRERKWLMSRSHTGGLRRLVSGTEALITAGQEKALKKRSIEVRVYLTGQDPRCRLCKDAPATVQHITAEWQVKHNWSVRTKWAL